MISLDNLLSPLLSLVHFDLAPQTELELVKEMSIDILPVETLEQIFSSDLNQVDLARLCQVSKLFRDIVRPQLYRSVTLQSIRQANQLKNSSEEDVKLVEEVRIVGKGDCFPVMKAKELRKAFFAMSEIERLGKEAGVVEELLEGKIVNPARKFNLSFPSPLSHTRRLNS